MAHDPCSCEQFEEWSANLRELQRTMRQAEQKGSEAQRGWLASLFGQGRSKRQKGAAAEKKGQGESLATRIWLSANTKACPRCSCLIQKNEVRVSHGSHTYDML